MRQPLRSNGVDVAADGIKAAICRLSRLRSAAAGAVRAAPRGFYLPDGGATAPSAGNRQPWPRAGPALVHEAVPSTPGAFAPRFPATRLNAMISVGGSHEAGQVIEPAARISRRPALKLGLHPRYPRPRPPPEPDPVRRRPAARLAALQPPSLSETAAALPHVPGSPRLGVPRWLRPVPGRPTDSGPCPDPRAGRVRPGRRSLRSRPYGQTLDCESCRGFSGACRKDGQCGLGPKLQMSRYESASRTCVSQNPTDIGGPPVRGT